MRSIFLSSLLALCLSASVQADGFAKNIPVAACATASNSHADGWEVTAGSYNVMSHYFKTGEHGLQEIGRTWGGMGLYPLPWCHLTFDETGACGFYWCGSHNDDTPIDPPQMDAPPLVTSNAAPEGATLTMAEGQLSFKVSKSLGIWDDTSGRWYTRDITSRRLQNSVPGSVISQNPPSTCLVCPSSGSSAQADQAVAGSTDGHSTGAIGGLTFGER